MAPDLLAFLTTVAIWIVADRGYASQAFRLLIWSLGSRPAIPAKRNEAPVACPTWIYANRNLVERCWNRLKEWRVSMAARNSPESSGRNSSLHSELVTAKSPRRSDSGKSIEVELDHFLQRLGGRGVAQAFGQCLGPGGILGL